MGRGYSTIRKESCEKIFVGEDRNADGGRSGAAWGAALWGGSARPAAPGAGQSTQAQPGPRPNIFPKFVFVLQRKSRKRNIFSYQIFNLLIRFLPFIFSFLFFLRKTNNLENVFAFLQFDLSFLESLCSFRIFPNCLNYVLYVTLPRFFRRIFNSKAVDFTPKFREMIIRVR